MHYPVSCDDAGNAARVAWAAALLFAQVSGMNAENDQRKAVGASMAYTDENYQDAIEACYGTATLR